MMLKAWPNFNRTRQAIKHRLRKLKVEFNSKIVTNLFKLVTPKKKVAENNCSSTTPLTKISSESSSPNNHNNKKRKRNNNNKYIGANVAAPFQDRKDNKTKIYTGIIISYLLLLYIIIIYIFLLI